MPQRTSGILAPPPWHTAKEPTLDRRSRKTRDALIEALFTLLKEKPLNALTVTELAGLADVNRATFYTHFHDVYDLYDHVQTEFCKLCSELVRAHASELERRSYRGLFEDLYAYLDEYEEVFSALLANTTDDSFMYTLIQAFHDTAMSTIAPAENALCVLRSDHEVSLEEEQLCRIMCDFQFDYLAGGIVNVLRSWMQRGRRESVQTMARFSADCLTASSPSHLAKQVGQLMAGSRSLKKKHALTS